MTDESSIRSDKNRVGNEEIPRFSLAGFWGLALASMGISVILTLAREKKNWDKLVGAWIPALLFLTVYIKLLEIEKPSARPPRRTPLH